MRQLQDWSDELRTTMDEDRRTGLGKKILATNAENVWMIGTVGLAPHPVVISERLQGVPTQGIWSGVGITVGRLRITPPPGSSKGKSLEIVNRMGRLSFRPGALAAIDDCGRASGCLLRITVSAGTRAW